MRKIFVLLTAIIGFVSTSSFAVENWCDGSGICLNASLYDEGNHAWTETDLWYGEKVNKIAFACPPYMECDAKHAIQLYLARRQSEINTFRELINYFGPDASPELISMLESQITKAKHDTIKSDDVFYIYKVELAALNYNGPIYSGENEGAFLHEIDMDSEPDIPSVMNFTNTKTGELVYRFISLGKISYGDYLLLD